MSSEQKVQFIHFVANPKRGNDELVKEKVSELGSLFAEIFDADPRNSSFHIQSKGKMWIIFMTFKNKEARDLLIQNPRFQELLTDLRAHCKHVHRPVQSFFNVPMFAANLEE